MNRKTLLLVPVVVMLAAVSHAQARYGGGGGSRSTPKVLKFNTMIGVNGAMLAPSEVRGIVGDALPWTA